MNTEEELELIKLYAVKLIKTVKEDILLYSKSNPYACVVFKNDEKNICDIIEKLVNMLSGQRKELFAKMLESTNAAIKVLEEKDK